MVEDCCRGKEIDPLPGLRRAASTVGTVDGLSECVGRPCCWSPANFGDFFCFFPLSFFSFRAPLESVFEKSTTGNGLIGVQ